MEKKTKRQTPNTNDLDRSLTLLGPLLKFTHTYMYVYVHVSVCTCTIVRLAD